MRSALFVLGAACALSLPASAQSVHPHAPVVAPHHAGEALRVTTADALPTGRARLDRYRGIRVYRSVRPTPRRAVQARVAVRTVRSTQRAYVQRGGASFPVVPQ